MEMPWKAWYCREWPNLKETWGEKWACGPASRNPALGVIHQTHLLGHLLSQAASWHGLPPVPYGGIWYPECVEITVMKAAAGDREASGAGGSLASGRHHQC